jgi:hypothetical protein
LVSAIVAGWRLTIEGPQRALLDGIQPPAIRMRRVLGARGCVHKAESSGMRHDEGRGA